MATKLVTSSGATLQLGRELGKGGEGSVYEVPSLSTQVAKLYHQPPDAKKQAKLSFMAGAGDPQLLNYVAWPQETLHASRNGPVVGFLMSKVQGRDPVHMVYSPAHRRQDRPNAAWDFLIYVARNTAASFAALHQRGHVLGDVNQGNVMVGGDSKVILIDSDSFQVSAPGTQHLCEVGVAHFTPPELQGLSSFKGFTRTANHDNFGLALLIFHLLFGGRHPYSGVGLANGVGDALEVDIKHFRYAYARDAVSRGIAPPPKTIPLSILPDSMEAMFHQAFTERGAAGARPTAKQWESALDGLRTRLKKCSASPVHIYPDHLTQCPWCALERQGVLYFVNLGTSFTATPNGFVLTQVWALIEAVPPPLPVVHPPIDRIPVKPRPLPAGVSGIGSVKGYRAIVVMLTFLGIVLFPPLWLLVVIVAWAAWAATSAIGENGRSAEKTTRLGDESQAREELNAVIMRANREAGPEGFRAIKHVLKQAHDDYLSLAVAEKNEIDGLQASAQTRQLQKFLERFFIDSAYIPGVGPNRKAALRSFGIETAADVERSRIYQVRGFGEGLTANVLSWRRTCERSFSYNAALAVTEADKNTVRAQYALRRKVVSTKLESGAGELQRFKQEALVRAAALQPQIDQAARKLAQACADLTVVADF